MPSPLNSTWSSWSGGKWRPENEVGDLKKDHEEEEGGDRAKTDRQRTGPHKNA